MLFKSLFHFVRHSVKGRKLKRNPKLGIKLWPWYVTWCSSCRRRWSWDSSCLLCSSKMCMRASSRPLCCRSSLASARRSASSGWADEPSDSQGPPAGVPRCPCCSFSCSYSLCSVLNENREQISGEARNVSTHTHTQMSVKFMWSTCCHIGSKKRKEKSNSADQLENCWELQSLCPNHQIRAICTPVWVFLGKYTVLLIFLRHLNIQKHLHSGVPHSTFFYPKWMAKHKGHPLSNLLPHFLPNLSVRNYKLQYFT